MDGNHHVLCEINVSSVFRIPDQAPAAIAQLTLERLLRTGPTTRGSCARRGMGFVSAATDQTRRMGRIRRQSSSIHITVRAVRAANAFPVICPKSLKQSTVDRASDLA